MAQAYKSGEAPELMQQLPGQAPAGLQATSPEPAYKKTKLAHLRVKVPGGVKHPPPFKLCLLTLLRSDMYTFSVAAADRCAWRFGPLKS